MRVEYIHFHSRARRTHYIADQFQPLLKGSVLDVGCDKALLKQLLTGIHYIGVDISGAPDVQLDLQRINCLPFADASFDCVICTDTLEHLDNLHTVFGQLIRVTKRYVIISFPNNWANARQPIQRGRGSFEHYGLPADAPADRHKWFFNFSEAMEFVQQQLHRYPISLSTAHVTEKPRPVLIRALRRLLYPSQNHYLNRYAHTLWVVLEKS
ncbi:MAG: class I SAM-dependent methyltransferase [bacterium]|nr:class I SAM-dependent methyltransferase [bacterium]